MSDAAFQPSPGWRLAGHAVLTAVCLSVVVPMAIVLGTSFKLPNEVYRLQPWPDAPTIDNYARLFAERAFGIYVWNSVATTALRVVGELFIALLAAYAFARWSFRGRDVLFVLVLSAMMVPPQLTMIPLYLLMAELDWFDTWTALIVPHLAMPYAAFLLRQHFLSIPRELYEAARMDGAGSWTTLWHVAVPNIGPAIAAIAIVLAMDSWNEYFWPMLMSTEPSSRTVQIGLREFVEEEFGNYGGLMAGAVLASLPMLLLFFLFQRRIVDTFVSSGVKG
jgi:multiple sugar transport system permease protein/sn-glycerol 3-phosphate transport system permease protein